MPEPVGLAATPCEVCEGKRFQAEVLEFTFGGKDIGEVLAMPVAAALPRISAPVMLADAGGPPRS